MGGRRLLTSGVCPCCHVCLCCWVQVTSRLKDTLSSLESWQLSKGTSGPPAPLSFVAPVVDVMLGIWMLVPDSVVICDPTSLGMVGKKAHSKVGGWATARGMDTGMCSGRVWVPLLQPVKRFTVYNW